MKSLSLAALAAALVSGAAAEEGRPRILSDGGPAHVHALYSENPIVRRFKGWYPRRVHFTNEDDESEFTFLNEGPQFQMAAGHYGKANLMIEMPAEDLAAVYEAVKSGSMPEGLPRIEMAIKIKEYTQVTLDNPQIEDKVPSGRGPKVSKRAGLMRAFLDTRVKGIHHMDKAGEAKGKGKKLPMLYHGLLSKLALGKADKIGAKLESYLMRELGRDLDEGAMDLTPGAWWSTFVDFNCFHNIIKHPQTYADVLNRLVKRIQGLMQYHKTLGESGDIASRTEILTNRLEVVNQLIELIDT